MEEKYDDQFGIVSQSAILFIKEEGKLKQEIEF